MKEKETQKYNQLALLFLLMFILGFVYIISGNNKHQNNKSLQKVVEKKEIKGKYIDNITVKNISSPEDNDKR